jgi:hypothetical protein
MGVKSSDEFKDRVNIATREEFEAIGDGQWRSLESYLITAELAARYHSLIKKIADGIQQRATGSNPRSIEIHS